jgi:CheY-like chemotaxis protein/two-component sensor histidine kinase
MVQPKLLDLRSILAGMRDMLRRVVSEDIEVVVSDGPEPRLIQADTGQIEQVILNLVINARDATPKGGRITITLDELTPDQERVPVLAGGQPRTHVRLTVSDTGYGMDPETKARIFEPFFTTKELGKGTGLGLATVYGIVQQTGGHIVVESEPGLGTRFEVYFPRAEGTLVQKRGALPATPAGGSECILLVEDQDGLRTLMCDILERHGYKVITAKNGREALQLAARHTERIDLMITDVVMPKLGGQEVANALPASHPEARVLYMSGYVENIHELLAQGQAFIDKPFSPEDLLQKVRQVLDPREDLRLPA